MTTDIFKTESWLRSNTFSCEQYSDLNELYEKKQLKKVRVSVLIPTLEEEDTIGDILKIIIQKLIKNILLVDEVIVIDGGSRDKTIEICESFGENIKLLHEKEIFPTMKTYKGKGNQLWKGLYHAKSDIIIYIDSDLRQFHERFIIGILGPLLMTDNIKFVKGFYERPINFDGSKPSTRDGGRVTELCARPLINMFYPELSGFIQPLGGEYGGYKDILENVQYSSGYGVEIKLLIEIYETFGIKVMGQCDLLERHHNHQPLNALSKMSFTIMKTVLENHVNVPFNNRLLIKNMQNLRSNNIKIRSDDHDHCNDNGKTMRSKYFKHVEIKEQSMPTICSLRKAISYKIVG